jgi:hypothetical protein
MLDEEAQSTAVAVRDEAQVERPLPPMTDAEVAAAYRAAKGFAEGGLFKDATKAGQAFTKILAGRDLGLTPFEAMAGIHVFDGKLEAGANLHATKVRQREGYDFRVAWLKVVAPPAREGGPPKVEAAWADEEAIDDLREVYGCAIMFTIGGKQRGVSRFTHADAVTAKLEKKDNHAKYPRNMFYARAMTNGVAWFVPEVMNGIRVYGEGELPRGGSDVAAGTSEHDAGAAGLELPMAVEAVLARARSLGHAGIASRAAAEFALRGRGGQDVADWVAARTRDLNRFAAGKPEVVPEVEPPEAEVVHGDAVDEVSKFGEPTPEEQAAANALGQAIVSSDFLGNGPARRAEPEAPAMPVDVPDEARREALRRRANDLLDRAVELEGRGEQDEANDARAEAENLMVEAGPPPEDPDQSRLEL